MMAQDEIGRRLPHSVSMSDYTAEEIALARQHFDVFQKTVNALTTSGIPYCNSFDFLEHRFKIAWLEVARQSIIDQNKSI